MPQVQVLKQRQRMSTLVDFGCGEAAFIKSALLDTAMPLLTHVAGVDISPTALARGKRLMSVALVKRQGPEWAAAPAPPAVQLYEARMRSLYVQETECILYDARHAKQCVHQPDVG